ncbi:MAG: hypothetical protein ACLR4Z_14390 [Butyricicoccaceae bacterium]
MAFGTQPKMVEEVVSAAKAKARKAAHRQAVPERHRHCRDRPCGRVCRRGRALAHQSPCSACASTSKSASRSLSNVMGGLSGPAVFPVAVRMVYQVRKAVSVPILGMGGIRTGRDIVEMLLAGADTRSPWAP